MEVLAFLSLRKKAITDKWFEMVIGDYPTETARFLRKEVDPFSNPVGFQLRRGLEELFEELIRSKASAHINETLEQLLKVRAVQDFPPSQGVGFILFLKQIVIEELEKELSEEEVPWRELMEWNDRIDVLMLLAFDIYTGCREKLFAIRIKELKESIPRVFRQINEKQCLGHPVEPSSLVTGSEG